MDRDVWYEAEPVVTRKPFREPEKLFTCADCQRDVMTNPWSNHSRGDQPVPPLCRSCECNSGVRGIRTLPATHMDKRIATQLAVIAQALSSAAYNKIHPMRY